MKNHLSVMCCALVGAIAGQTKRRHVVYVQWDTVESTLEFELLRRVFEEDYPFHCEP